MSNKRDSFPRNQSHEVVRVGALAKVGTGGEGTNETPPEVVADTQEPVVSYPAAVSTAKHPVSGGNHGVGGTYVVDAETQTSILS